MENEGLSKSQGPVDISETPDPTQAMPPFPEGSQVDSMSVGDAQAEWQDMTLDKEGKYASWPRSVFNERRKKLFDKGFSQKIQEDRKTQEQSSREWLEKENERIGKRDDLEALAKAKKEAERYFGGEEKAEGVLQIAQEVLKQVATEEDLNFLDSTGLGNSPRISEIIANLSRNQELYPIVRKIGLANLIRLGQAVLRRWG